MSEENKISADLIADIFDIPVGKNINDDDEMEELGKTQTTVSFDDKAVDVAVQMGAVPETPVAKTEPKVTPKVEVKPEPKVEPKVEPKAEPVKKVEVQKKPESKGVEAALIKTAKPKLSPEIQMDMFDGVETEPETVKVEPKLVVKVENSGVKIEALDNKTQDAIKQAIHAAAVEYEEEESDKEKNKPVPSNTQWEDDEDWLLTSPGPKYNRFYEEKRNVLNDGPRGILAKGKLDFNKLFDELANLTCDMTVTTYDAQAIYEKMVCVQQMRERAREIQLVVSRQYFLWKRYIELFQGILAGAEYVRGKQDGVCFEHMRDMEHYFCSLEALHKGTETIFKTLDAAFDVLSRQVTIIMPMKDVERQMPNNYSSPTAPKPMTNSMKKFDSLGTKNDTKPSDGESSKVATGWNL